MLDVTADDPRDTRDVVCLRSRGRAGRDARSRRNRRRSGAGVAADPACRRTNRAPRRLKTDAVADVEAMSVFTQQMVDSVFSFGELGFQEFETNRYLIDILKKNGFTRRGRRSPASRPRSWRPGDRASR